MVLVGCGVGLGVLLVLRGLAPPRTDLAVAIGRWQSSRRLAARRVEREASPGTKDRIGGWLADRLHRSGIEFPNLRADLEILNRRLEDYLVSALITFVIGFFIPTIFGLLFALGGLSIGFIPPLALGLVVGAVFVTLNAVQLHRDAEQRRTELRHALAVYLELVGMGLMSGRGLPEALPLAAEIGTGWAFDLLETTLRRARNSGKSAWVGWDELGYRVDVQELCDLGSSVELVGEEGAKVQQSLAARATTMRRRELAEDEGQALKNEDSMRMAAMVLVMGFIVFIGFPAIMSVLAA
ncbi:MAG: type II secretion system F family protein [Nocardioidaceae bacterium]